MLWMAKPESTTSKLLSAKGSAVMSPVCSSTRDRSLPPRRHCARWPLHHSRTDRLFAKDPRRRGVPWSGAPRPGATPHPGHNQGRGFAHRREDEASRAIVPKRRTCPAASRQDTNRQWSHERDGHKPLPASGDDRQDEVEDGHHRHEREPAGSINSIRTASSRWRLLSHLK
jgi:hypothetical protein